MAYSGLNGDWSSSCIFLSLYIAFTGSRKTPKDTQSYQHSTYKWLQACSLHSNDNFSCLSILLVGLRIPYRLYVILVDPVHVLAPIDDDLVHNSLIPRGVFKLL